MEFLRCGGGKVVPSWLASWLAGSLAGAEMGICCLYVGAGGIDLERGGGRGGGGVIIQKLVCLHKPGQVETIFDVLNRIGRFKGGMVWGRIS